MLDIFHCTAPVQELYNRHYNAEKEKKLPVPLVTIQRVTPPKSERHPMTFEQLSMFTAAAGSDTFFDAAEQLHTTQSTLSKQIRRLEEELGFALFDRSRRCAFLTPAGEAFLPEADALLSHYQNVMDKMSAYKVNAKQSLSVGTLPILAQYDLMAPLHAFIKENPALAVSVTEAEEPALLEGLETGRFSMILARDSMINQDRFAFYPVIQDRLVVVLAAAHPLASCNTLSPEELSREPLLLMHPYTCIYQLCMSLFAARGLTPHVLRTARQESLLSAIGLQEGIGLLPAENLRVFRHDSLVTVDVPQAPPLWVGIACKKEHSAPAPIPAGSGKNAGSKTISQSAQALAAALKYEYH